MLSNLKTPRRRLRGQHTISHTPTRSPASECSQKPGKRPLEDFVDKLLSVSPAGFRWNDQGAAGCSEVSRRVQSAEHPGGGAAREWGSAGHQRNEWWACANNVHVTLTARSHDHESLSCVCVRRWASVRSGSGTESGHSNRQRGLRQRGGAFHGVMIWSVNLQLSPSIHPSSLDSLWTECDARPRDGFRAESFSELFKPVCKKKGSKENLIVARENSRTQLLLFFFCFVFFGPQHSSKDGEQLLFPRSQ